MGVRGITTDVSLLLSLLVEFLEMPNIRGRAGDPMAVRKPGMRDMLSRLQLSRICRAQKIQDAGLESLRDIQHMSASGVAAGVDACMMLRG
jgi:hypothetical protein